jgi:glycosyltransferase involved in cell wall biosynthesis
LFIDAQYLFGLEYTLKGFDIVHTAETYYHYTQQCLNAKKKGYVKKVVATVLENIPFNNEGIWGRNGFKMRARNELDHMVALTERTKAALVLEGADPKKITIISHYIDTKRFSPSDKRHVTSDTKTQTILYCGRLEKYKGVYEILYAAKLLSLDPEIRDIHLKFIFVGDGTEKERMIAKEKELHIDRMMLHKKCAYDDMPAIYKEADIYVAPTKGNDTWLEQYNTTLLEAQACGLPIVTTYNGGIPENVGDAAVCVPPADVYALAQSIKSFILHPSLRNSYAKKARERAVTVHDIAHGAQKLSALYDMLLS